MPPTRTIPPAKAVKTERTHEENQERAYIAASRRSDRSLEARVESARRASEIHKRRTGRSLRVTEQDVINEEMYEEEDDDLPLQYRRLTAHLQTGSADFNRRLAAYLTNQVAMRSAMEHMVNNNPYGQNYPPNPQYPYQPQQRPNMFSSPMAQQPMAQSPASAYRAAPYPSPHTPGFRQQHGRAYSTAVISQKPGSGPSTPAVPHPSLDQRRMSTPATVQPVNTQEVKPDPEYIRQTQSAMTPSYHSGWPDMNPFTTSLPVESQQMLGPALDPNDPFSQMLMNGADAYSQAPYYGWSNMQQPMKGMNNPYQGMSATLAPSMLDNSGDSLSITPTSNGPPTSDAPAPSTGIDFNFSQESKGLHLNNFPSLSRQNSYQGLPSGQITPGEGFWDNFVQDGGWSEEPVAI